MRSDKGSQERYRYEKDPTPPAGMVGGFYLVKNHLYERYSYDESWIYLVEDISPDDGDDGEPCFYRVMESPSD